MLHVEDVILNFDGQHALTFWLKGDRKCFSWPWSLRNILCELLLRLNSELNNYICYLPVSVSWLITARTTDKGQFRWRPTGSDLPSSMWANEQWANFAIGESSLVLQHNQASIHSLTVYKRCAFQISGLKSETCAEATSGAIPLKSAGGLSPKSPGSFSIQCQTATIHQ